jgi:hypothetical protein
MRAKSFGAVLSGVQWVVAWAWVAWVACGMLSRRAPCKGVGLQWVRFPPGSLVILAGSSSSDSGGNKRVEALNDKGSFQRFSKRAGRNLRERRAGPENAYRRSRPSAFIGEGHSCRKQGNDP